MPDPREDNTKFCNKSWDYNQGNRGRGKGLGRGGGGGAGCVVIATFIY